MALSVSAMRRRIWRVLESATAQEVRDGFEFYPGAHGLCRFFAMAHRVSPAAVAGIYAALSPMNGWYTNVANVLDVLRDGDLARVNTSESNRQKALRILAGENPGVVLCGGRKVYSFYRAIADPGDTTPIPVDRHLLKMATGCAGDKVTLSRMSSDRDVYDRVERAFFELGRREGVGNRLASVAWFVQRRIAGDQIPLC